MPNQVLEDVSKAEIIGKWTMCQKGYESHIISSNICTDIVFFENGTGVIKTPGDSLGFTWLINSNIIKSISVTKNKEKHFLPVDGEFTFTKYEDKNVQWFKLLDTSTGHWYRLGKNK